MSARLIRIAALYLVVGVAMGIVMGIQQQFSPAPVHAHINLLGFASLAIIGAIYKLYPDAAKTRLAHIHFWIHNTALPVFMIGLALLLTGHEAFVPVAIVGATAVAVGILAFAANIWLTVRPVASDAGMKPAAPAAA